MSIRELKILDRELDLCENVFRKYPYLPELKKFLGADKFYEFLEIFAGCQIRIPSETELNRRARDYDIYKSLNAYKSHERTSGAREELLQRLAKKYNLSDVRIRCIYKEVQKLYEEDSK